MRDEDRPDEELVRLCQDSHKEMFNELVRRYYRRIFNYVVSVVRKVQDAEDVVQETFFRAYRYLHQCKNPDKFAGWLFAIASEQSRYWLRRQRGYLFHASLAGLQQEDKPTCRKGEMLDIMDAVARLPDEQRQVFVLKHQDGLSCKEIAAMLDKPLGTITGWLSRAYENLRTMLGKEGEYY
jgi:RNA polymerase sigma-70 factor (ECF subfamily)